MVEMLSIKGQTSIKLRESCTFWLKKHLKIRICPETLMSGLNLMAVLPTTVPLNFYRFHWINEQFDLLKIRNLHRLVLISPAADTEDISVWIHWRWTSQTMWCSFNQQITTVSLPPHSTFVYRGRVSIRRTECPSDDGLSVQQTDCWTLSAILLVNTSCYYNNRGLDDMWHACQGNWGPAEYQHGKGL